MMELAAAVMTLIVLLANTGEAGKSASPESNESHNTERSSAHVDDRSLPICPNHKVIYRDLTVPYAQAGETRQLETSEVSK